MEGTPYYKSGFGIIDDFQPFNLFDYPMEWSKADTGIYRRFFTIAPDLLNERVVIRFEGIMQTARIYLNEVAVGDWDEAYLPFEVDITKHLKKDALNELIVVCSTFEEITLESGQTKSLGLLGSWFGFMGRGIWSDVFLESRPLVGIEDIYIKTSVREKSISSEITIENVTECEKRIDVELDIYDDQKKVKSFCKRHVQITGCSRVVLNLSRSWPDPCLWSMENPHLYTLKVNVYEDGFLVDKKDVRFGFREIWIDGHKFVLNGIRVNLRGDSWHFQGTAQQTKEYALNWFKMCREYGINFVRLHAEPHPSYYLEAADETGILVIDETAIYGSGKSMAAGHPVYIERCKKHVERLLRRDRNHPSVIMWSLQNEMRWVDGRDQFKKHIPDFIQIFKRLDDTRPVILEGDNRLISKEAAEIYSYHYNIDGTIAQWDREKPLVFGEHGGWWYICPQNFSAYSGHKAYLSWEGSAEGAALKERLYVEYARSNDVSGITSFNFAHYFMKSMPDRDVPLSWDRLDTEGCKPKVIKKNSLTINNGLIKNYPAYVPNISANLLADCYREAVIIAAEYDSSFFDDRELCRNFDVYNDTLKTVRCDISAEITNEQGEVIFAPKFDFLQEPGIRERVSISFYPPRIGGVTKLFLKMMLYHNSEEVYCLYKEYKIYPGEMKAKGIVHNDRNFAYWGNSEGFSIIKGLLPSCEAIRCVEQILTLKPEILIIGSYISSRADRYQSLLEEYQEKGGVIVILEQNKFTAGKMILSKQRFFSAHINDSSHRLVEGLSDEDLIFWKPEVIEETPESIIEQCYLKPVKGDFNIILECSTGDYGDGGDLWTPLLEYKYSAGTMILNQLELMANFNNIPQACLLLRNILEYAAGIYPNKYLRTGVIALGDSDIDRFIKGTGLDFDLIGWEDTFEAYKNIIVQTSGIPPEQTARLTAFAEKGGKVLLLSAGKEADPILKKLLGCEVEIKNLSTYQLKRTYSSELTKGLSIYDMFRIEKVNFCPRLVDNSPICRNTISVQGADILLESVNGTPWYDYYVRDIPDEYARMALVEINREKAFNSDVVPYMVEKPHGCGSFIISQVETYARYEKNVRFYSRLFANMGSEVQENIFNCIKGDKDYSVDCFMTLPHEEYKDNKSAEAYFSDRDYSLNNLGEGLYGWMKKVEKSLEDGFINIPNSKGKTYFTSCFIDYSDCKNGLAEPAGHVECSIDIDCNSDFKLWVNGDLMKQKVKHGTGTERTAVNGIVLNKGLNRLIVILHSETEDVSFRVIFKTCDGDYMDDIRYQLTINEVDPK